jgi:hypothetical protein
MSARQLIRAWYVLGTAFSGVADYVEARFWLDKVAQLAYEQSGPGDLPDLLYLCGAINRGALRYADMADDYRAFPALALGDRPFRADALDAPLTLEVLLQLAGVEFFVAHYDAAERLLATAAPLLPSGSGNPMHQEISLVTGTHAWFQALIYRWRGMPNTALTRASTAARIYTALGSPISTARSQVLVEDITLDLAARARHENERRLQATLAGPHLEAAYQLAAQAGDPYGECLCALADTRLSRLSGLHADRVAAIERVAQTGQRLGDEAILAQAFTALGDELMAQGQLEAAAHRYDDVRQLLDGSDVPALGVWARRAAHRLTEQHPNR